LLVRKIGTGIFTLNHHNYYINYQTIIKCVSVCLCVCHTFLFCACQLRAPFVPAIPPLCQTVFLCAPLCLPPQEKCLFAILASFFGKLLNLVGRPAVWQYERSVCA